jgi:hypothetical protein
MPKFARCLSNPANSVIEFKLKYYKKVKINFDSLSENLNGIFDTMNNNWLESIFMS